MSQTFGVQTQQENLIQVAPRQVDCSVKDGYIGAVGYLGAFRVRSMAGKAKMVGVGGT
jgi:hypothetical protein